MSLVAQGLADTSLPDGRAIVLAVRGVRGDAFTEARAISLLRALACYGDVTLLDLDGSEIDDPARAISQAVQEQGAGVAIVCCAGDAGRISWRDIVSPAVIAAPARVGPAGLDGDLAVLGGIRNTWVRSDAEAERLRRQFPGVEITVVPDHFDIFAPEPGKRRAGAIALLASADAPSRAIGDMWGIAVEDAPEGQQVLAPALVHDMLAARGLGGQAIRVGSVKEAIALCPRILVHADDPEAHYLATCAAASECEVRIAGLKERGVRQWASAARLQSDVVGVVGEALGAGSPSAEETLVGDRLGRAVGMRLDTDFVYYIPSMQLVHAELIVHAAIPAEAIGGYLETRGGERDRLVNAWVQVVDTNVAGTHRLRATAAMPPGGRPDRIDLTVELWGHTVARIELGPQVAEIGAGLIAMTPVSDKRVSVEYWAPPSGATIQFGTKPVVADPSAVGGNGLATYRVEAAYPFNRDTLTVLTGGVVGRIQRFTQLPTYTKDYRPSSLRLAALKDVHEGRTAWLVGNGPSVRTEDLDLLADSNAIKFCFNRFYLAHERTRLVADYTVSADQQMIADFGEEMLERSGGTVFMADFAAPQLSGDYCWVRQVNVFPSLFSRDPTRFVTPGGSSLYVAMQIGYYMGIRKWYVYGADFEFNLKREKASADVWRAATGDNNHFIPGYRSGKAWCPPAIENILPSFLGARQLIELDGGFVRNATRGGRLDVFDRISFEDALAAS